MYRKKVISFNYMRSLLIAWLVLMVIVGCATQQQLSPPPSTTHFITVIPQKNESLVDIASQHLDDSNLSFRISEFNNVNVLHPNQPLVVPLKPLYPYGVRRTALQTIPVLSYHAFSWKTSNNMTIREKDFEAQMSYLKTNGYHVVPLSRMLDFFNGKELPEKSVVITIDDGWGSAYRIAYPILRKYGYPYTLFIQTNLINSAFKTLDWDQIREMLSNSNLSIGSHTATHRDLAQQKKGESFAKYFSSIRQDLSLAKKIIFQETGVDPVHLAYPYGSTSQLVMDLVKELGYSSAYTIIRNPNSILSNPLKFNRSMIYGTYNLEQFEDQLTTLEYYDLKNEHPNIKNTINQPSEYTAQRLEDNEYWLRSLNHWRLIRDTLLQKIDDKQGNKISFAKQKIDHLENHIKVLANEHYEKGLHYFSASKTSKGTREMLKALYFNPELQKARNRLYQEINKPNYLTVSVKDGDTSKKIAKQTYKDISKFSLVSYYADKQGGLIPGMALKLPELPIKKVISKPKPKSTSKIVAKKACGVVLLKSKIALSKDFLNKAELLFNKDQITKARESIKISVCLDPENTFAVELSELFEGIAN